MPVFFFGHSMGSLIGLAYLVHHSAGLAGGVLCGFAANLDDTASLGALLQSVAEAGMRDASAADLLAANNAPFEPARTKFDWLSRDEAEVDAYAADPFCGDSNPLTFGYFIDLFDVMVPAAARLGDIECPVLVIAGDQDPAAGMGAFVTVADSALRSAGVQSSATLYAGARHEVVDSPALPKPAQRPHPPIVMGGYGAKRTPMLAARYASEFNLPFADLDTFTTALARVEAACQAIDRDPVTMHRSVALCVACGEDDAEVDRRAAAAGHDPVALRGYGLAGTPSEVVARIEAYRAAGAQRVYLQVLDLDDLDHLDLIAAEVLPEVSA